MLKKTANITEDWQQTLATLKANAFPNPWEQDDKSMYTYYVQKVAELEDKMQFKEEGPKKPVPYIVYGGSEVDVTGQGVPNFEQCNKVEMPLKYNDVENVMIQLLQYLFNKMNNTTHPLTIANVLAPTSIISALGIILSSKLNPNAIEARYAVNVSKAELETASMIIHLLNLGNDYNQWPQPWAPPSIDSAAHYRVDDTPGPGSGSGGIATFGGTGCYLYAIKYALTKVAQSVLNKGETIRASGINSNKFVVIVSNQGHYCSSNVTDWLGIGYDQVIAVQTTPENSMDLTDLQKKLNDCKTNGKVVIAVVPTFGTTDAAALEDIAAVREIVQKFDNIADPVSNKRYAKPIIYVDSACGWVWLCFAQYDFDKNPLGFSDDEVCDQIKKSAQLAEGLSCADAFAVDLHKTGYSPYPASMVMLKDYGGFVDKLQRPAPPYLPQEQYDPGLYTLETSRTTMGYVSAWSNFMNFGLNGIRTLTYHLICQTKLLRQKLRQTGNIIICNEKNNFFSTLVRCYPGPYTREQYEQELTDEDQYPVFHLTNELQRSIYHHLLKDFRFNDGSPEMLSTPNFSLTTGFRNTYYNPDGEKTNNDGEPLQGVFALKCYLNSPFLDEKYLDIMVANLQRGLKEAQLEILKKAATLDIKEADKFQRAKLPKGVHRNNHLIPALRIPRKLVLPKKFDYTADPDCKAYLEKLEKEKAQICASILKLQEKEVSIGHKDG